MKHNSRALVCLLAAGGCFYGANAAGLEAERLREQAADRVDQVLGMGRYYKPARTLPNGVEEENPWVVDPAETVERPENRKLVEQSDATFAAAKAWRMIGTALRSGGYALAGLAGLLLALPIVREAFVRVTAEPPAKEVGDASPPPA